MGLLTIIKKQKLKDREIKCLVLGLDNSGKSTIVNQLLPKEDRDTKITPTVGFQIRSTTFDNGRYNINLWDIGGQTSLRPFWDNYLDRTDVLLWVLDVSLPIRFSESFKELEKLVLFDEDRIGYNCHVIVVLNKVDLLQRGPRGATSAREDSITDEHVAQFKMSVVKKLGARIPSWSLSSYSSPGDDTTLLDERLSFIECSAVTGYGIDRLKACIVSSRRQV